MLTHRISQISVSATVPTETSTKTGDARPVAYGSSLALFVLAAGLLFPAGAQSTNLIANPGFDTDLGGWYLSKGEAVVGEWSANDQLSDPLSGAVRFANLAPSHVPAAVSACFPVTPGATLVFGASYRASADSESGLGFALVRMYPDANCAGSLITAPQPSGDLRHYFGRQTWGPVQSSVTVPPTAGSARLWLRTNPGAAPPAEVLIDNAFAYEGESCVTTPHTICLGEAGRFRVSAEWQKPTGERGWSRTEYLTDNSGHLWFFNPSNVEGLLKVHDACSFNDRFWVFAAGLTNLFVRLDVYDTHTGETWTHTNEQGEAFQPVQDTEAFATCPMVM